MMTLGNQGFKVPMETSTRQAATNLVDTINEQHRKIMSQSWNHQYDKHMLQYNDYFANDQPKQVPTHNEDGKKLSKATMKAWEKQQVAVGKLHAQYQGELEKAVKEAAKLKISDSAYAQKNQVLEPLKFVHVSE